MPSGDQLNEAMMKAELRLLPPRLAGGRTDVRLVNPNDPLKKYTEPIRWRGQYAVVYRYLLPNNEKVAVRCFYSADQSMRRRYSALSQYLRTNAKGITVSFFDYFEEGVIVGNNAKTSPRCPIVLMEFVEGRTLLDEIGVLCAPSFSNGQLELSELCKKWEQLLQSMKSAKIAHGDLSGGNVMVRKNKSLVLVDYDGMYIPLLQGDPPSEKGNKDYQHPGNATRPYDERMDDFSALAIYVAIRALTRKRELFDRFVVRKSTGEVEGDNLLFRQKDYEDPGRSAVFAAIRKECSSDGQLLDLLRALEKACVGPIGGVRSFGEFVDPWAALKAEAARIPVDWGAVCQVCDATVAAAPQAAIPDALLKIVTEARRRVGALRDVEKSLMGEYSAYTVKAVYEGNRPLLDKWKQAEGVVKRAECACRQVDVLEELSRSVPHSRLAGGMVQLYSARRHLLVGCKEAREWERKADAWGKRNDLCGQLLRLVQQIPHDSDIAVGNTWEELVKLGGHLDADPYAKSVQEAVRRRDCLLRVREVPEEQTEAADRAYCRCWDDSLLQKCPDVQASERTRWANANSRVATLDNLHRVIGDVESHRRGTELDIVNAAQTLLVLSGYQYDDAQRVAVAAKRVSVEKDIAQSEAALVAALGQVPISDLTLDAAVQNLLSVQAKYKDAWGKTRTAVALSGDQQSRLNRARFRAPKLKLVIDALRGCKSEQDQDEAFDRRLTKGWRSEDFLEPPGATTYCADAAGIVVRVERASERLLALNGLRAALDGLNVFKARARDVVQAANALPAWYLQKLGADQDKVENAKERVRNTNCLASEFAKPPAERSDLVIAERWEALVMLGGDPEAEEYRGEALRACQRATRLREIQKVHSQQSEASDAVILDQWDEDLLKGRMDAEKYRDRLGVARRRRDRAKKVRTAIQKVDRRHKTLEEDHRARRPLASFSDDEHESAIVTASAAVPADGFDDAYLKTLGGAVLARVKDARVRDQAAKTVSGKVDLDGDQAIADAWDRLEKAGGDPAAEQYRPRATLARTRCDGLQQVTRILALPRRLSADEEDKKLLDVWRVHQLEPCKDVPPRDPLRTRMRLAQERVHVWGLLEDALRKSDREEGCFAVVDLYRQEMDRKEPLLRGYPPFQEQLATIERIVGNTKQFQDFWQALIGADPKRFADTFDCTQLDEWARKFPARLQQHWSTIRGRIRRDLLPAFPLKANPSYASTPPREGGKDKVHWQRPVVGNGGMEVHWHWPKAALKVSHCWLCACWDARIDHPGDVDHYHEVSREVFDRSGSTYSLSFPPGGGRILHVAIWPVVKLNGITKQDDPVYGDPLRLAYDLAAPQEDASDDDDDEPEDSADRMADLFF